MAIEIFQCSNCGNTNYKPLLGNSTTCDCGLRHPSYLWSYSEEEESVGDLNKHYDFLEEAQNLSSGLPEEDWRSILDEEAEIVSRFVGEDPDIDALLREKYPHGHERFIDLCLEEMELHSKKNYDYAHGGNPLGNFVRVANILSNYPGLKLTPPVVALIYAMKQLDAVLWQVSQGYEGQVEGIDDKAQDISVYVKLFRILLEEV